MSGHSKWHSIKHKKGAADKKRGKLFGKLVGELPRNPDQDDVSRRAHHDPQLRAGEDAIDDVADR